MIKVKVKLEECATLPTYETCNAAGADVRAYIEEKITVNPLERALIPTGIKLEIPTGYEIQVRPRSGLSLKEGKVAILGTIDSDYRGGCGVIICNLSNNIITIEPNERIGQFVLNKVERADYEIVYENLTETKRGENGFGHTGK